MSEKESEVTVIPKVRRVFRDTKANLDTLVGLRDGALAYGTDTTLLYRQNGDGAANWEAITTISTATKEFFIPSTFGDSGIDALLAYPRSKATNGQHGNICFGVPADFSTITTAEAIIRYAGLGSPPDADIDILSTYAAVGQAYNTHNESDNATTYNITDQQLVAIDVSGILTSLAAGDIVGIQIANNEAADILDLFGLRFKYA